MKNYWFAKIIFSLSLSFSLSFFLFFFLFFFLSFFFLFFPFSFFLFIWGGGGCRCGAPWGAGPYAIAFLAYLLIRHSPPYCLWATGFNSVQLYHQGCISSDDNNYILSFHLQFKLYLWISADPRMSAEPCRSLQSERAEWAVRSNKHSEQPRPSGLLKTRLSVTRNTTLDLVPSRIFWKAVDKPS